MDDDPISTRIVEAFLSEMGYITTRAMDGETCIEKVRRIMPNLILLDIYMNEMSGIEVSRVLKQDEDTKDIPIIFVTANTDEKVLKEAFESGGTDYVRKPVNKTELLARVNSALTQEILRAKLIDEEKLRGAIEMAGAVCHEMNQPMQVVLGNSELLMLDVEYDHPLYRKVEEIIKATGEMAEITMRLMKITKYETCDYIDGKKIIDIRKSCE
jgi:CheY-like chemotaxis protein